MEVTLEGGVQVDLATTKDVQTALSNRPYRERVEFGKDGVTDSNGQLLLASVLDVPDGKTFFLYKLILWVAGFDAGNVPTLGSKPWMGLYHGNQFAAANLADYAPANNATFSLPATFEYNSHTAPEFRSPDNLSVGIYHAIANTNMLVKVWGELQSVRYVRNY